MLEWRTRLTALSEVPIEADAGRIERIFDVARRMDRMRLPPRVTIGIRCPCMTQCGGGHESKRFISQAEPALHSRRTAGAGRARDNEKGSGDKSDIAEAVG